jgi:hypothetical protein
LARVWRKGSLCTFLVGIQINIAIMETSERFLNILKIELYNPAILILDICSKELNPGSQRDSYTHVLIAVFIIATIWKQPKFPSVRKWIKKMWHTHSVGYYSAFKKRIPSSVHK